MDGISPNEVAAAKVALVMEEVIFINRVLILSFGVAVVLFFFISGDFSCAKASSARSRDIGQGSALVKRMLMRYVGYVSLDTEEHDAVQVKPAQAFSTEDVCGAQVELIADLLQGKVGEFLVAVDERQPLTYERLRQFLLEGAADLTRHGIGGSYRVALLLGSGPEVVVALLALTSQCAVAPLDPKLSDEELVFSLSDLPAKTVVALREHAPRVRGVPVIELEADLSVVGLFSLHFPAGWAIAGTAAVRKPPTGSSTAIVLHTSGTTRKPKVVPITHEHLVLAALCIRRTLRLEPGDRCLNVMPLFHIGGISCNILATAAASASVICAPVFSGPEALGLLETLQPSWYYAGPTIHIMMMRQEDRSLHPGSLKFIRNAAAALLPSVAEDMAFTFRCEVIPTYGMTEAMPVCSHQRGAHVRLASVGPAAGPEVKVDEHGEVCVRGRNVTKGYEVREHMEENPNDWAFDAAGWFHTGDCGALDDEGYLTLSGRKKELILRGGEKISPFQIEDAVRDPSVLEAVAFAAPHAELGEVVGVAVRTTEADEEMGALLGKLRDQCSASLPDKWLPEVVVKMDVLPKGPSGKPLRSGLAERIGLTALSVANMDSGCEAYVYDGTKLRRLNVSESDVRITFDSLGGVRRESQRSAYEREVVLAVYAVAAFGVVSEHTSQGLRLAYFMTPWGEAALEMMTLSMNMSSYWTLTAFIVCSAFLYAPEPFEWHRVVMLLAMYALMLWPWQSIALLLHGVVSGPPAEGTSYSQAVIQGVYGDPRTLIEHRYFLIVLLAAYCLFAAGRRSSVAPHVQCLLAAAFTIFWIPNGWYSWKNPAPFLVPWVNLYPVHGVHMWGFWLTVYLITGHYGRRILAAVRTHRLAQHERLQRLLPRVSAILLVCFLAPFFLTAPPFFEAYDRQEYQDWHHWAITAEFSSMTHQASRMNRILDMACSLVLVGLLFFAVQVALRPLGWLGGFSLGTFCAHRSFLTVTTCGPPTKTGRWESNQCLSFGVRVAGVQILPPLQTMIERTAGYTGVQLLLFACYVLATIVCVGVPVHFVLLRTISALQRLVRLIPPGFPRFRGAPPEASSSSEGEQALLDAGCRDSI